MSEFSTPEERTELPTDRRMGELRRELSVHHSTEVEQTLSMLTGFLMVCWMMPTLLEHSQYVMRRAFQLIAREEPFTVAHLQDGFESLLLLLGPDIAIIIGIVAAVSSYAVFFQTKWCIRQKKIKFDLNGLNPISGISRIVSINGLINTLKALFKLMFILPIGYWSLQGFAPQMVQLMHLQIDQIFIFAGTAMRSVFWKIFYVMAAIAVFDWCYGRWRWMRMNKMTKDEVKDERKSIEGDEATKKKIQRKGMERLMQRIQTTVPQADVVVTNPTHFAVALKYDRTTMNAPMVVAKGADHLAKRIREIARESGVPVLERKMLARALYSSTEVGAVIPRELFKAVAEVLAYVYRIKNPFRNQQGAQR